VNSSSFYDLCWYVFSVFCHEEHSGSWTKSKGVLFCADGGVDWQHVQ
jgi:hypothetical protein